MNSMLTTLIGTAIFMLGFTLGVWERKVEKLKINRQTFKKAVDSNAEILMTPTQEQIEVEENREFYAKIK